MATDTHTSRNARYASLRIALMNIDPTDFDDADHLAGSITGTAQAIDDITYADARTDIDTDEIALVIGYDAPAHLTRATADEHAETLAAFLGCPVRVTGTYRTPQGAVAFDRA